MDAAAVVNADGQAIQLKGTRCEFYHYAERSFAETSAQTNTGRMELAGDDGGHIIGHRFVLNEGVKNMIHKNTNLNRSAYSTMENELADWIAAGAEVNIDVKLSGYVDGWPQEESRKMWLILSVALLSIKITSLSIVLLADFQTARYGRYA